MVRFYHEVHEGHEVNISRGFSLVFVHLRVLCGASEKLNKKKHEKKFILFLVRVFMVIHELFNNNA